MTALVLTLCALLGYRSPPPAIVHAIADASATAEDAALLVVYAVHESGISEHPRPVSADALDGRSCGVWQQMCARVRSMTVSGQARLWLDDVRRSGLAAVDSSPMRAAARTNEARALLSRLP